jgi:glyoxylase-like metal-dependent hydrolase (beta-lactamase superfamily II)
MNPNEQTLHYPWDEQLPEIGQAIDVIEGLRWVRLPLPFALDHVNVWLVRDTFEGRQGWTLIDCGVARDPVKAQWEQVFNNCLDNLPIVRVLVTHMHPDHIGLAGWICERWNAPLWMTMTDFFVASLWTATAQNHGARGGESAVDYCSKHGLCNPGQLDQIRKRSGYYPNLVSPLPSSFRRLVDGETVHIGSRDWRVIIGYGHAPEHISLYNAATAIFVAGDMVLPRISTNVSVFDYEPDGNPLQLYLDSLNKYERLPADALVLPSHGRPFYGLHTRIQQQRDHHRKRLEEVLSACGKDGRTAADIIPVLFKRTLDTHQLTFALGEAIAHLNTLVARGQLVRRDTDNVQRFYPADLPQSGAP